MTLCVKLLSAKTSPPFPSWQIVFFRSITQLLLSLVFLGYYKINPFGPPNYRLLLLARGACGALGLACFFYGITQLSLADATVIFFSNPVVTVFMAWIFLGEAIMWIDMVVGIVCFIGVGLVARPTFIFGDYHGHGSHSVIAVVITLGGAFMAASAYVLVRKIGHSASFMNSVFAFGFVSSIISPIGLYVFQWEQARVPDDVFSWVCLVLTGVLAFGAQCLLNKGLQLERAGPATLMRNLDTVFAFIFDFTILHHKPNLFSVIGASLILLVTVVLALKRYYHV